MVGGGGPLDTPDEVVLPKEFSRISPSEPRERRRKARLREALKGVLTLSSGLVVEV